MMCINNVSSQFPGEIKRAVMVVVQSPCSTKIRCLLLNALNLVSEHTNICMCVLAYIACVLHACDDIISDTDQRHAVVL